MTPDREYDYATSTYLTLPEFGAEAREGHFRSKHGFVNVYVSPVRAAKAGVHLQFIWRGRSYHRLFERILGNKTIARLAREFADDVVSRDA